MNRNQFAGQWRMLRGKVQEEWGKITDNDLDKIEGRQEQLVGMIQLRYGLAREDAERAVEDWLERVEV